MTKLVTRLVAAVVLGAMVTGAYIAVPFWTAWTIREAMKDNDSAYLEKKIEWASVRVSLKESLAKFAFNASGDIAELPEKPSVWQKIKSFVGKGAVDSFVDTTVTPTGIHGLFKMRKAYQASIGGDDPSKRPPAWQRMRRLWSLTTRAEFASLSRLEMDMIDKQSPDRTINCVLELRGFEWKMTEIRVKPTDSSRIQEFTKVVASMR